MKASDRSRKTGKPTTRKPASRELAKAPSKPSGKPRSAPNKPDAGTVLRQDVGRTAKPMTGARPVPRPVLRQDSGGKVKPLARPPGPPPPPTVIPKGGWSGYQEYIGPHGEMVMYLPRIKLPPKAKPPVPPAPAGAPQDNVPPPRKPAAADDHPRTVSRPPAPGQQVKPAEPPPPQPAGQPANDDVDEELRRHRDWLRHRFDPPPPPRPRRPRPPLDRTRPGTYQRLKDEADETARRIAALEQERHDSLLPDWLWDQLYGQELRILLVHLRALRWQIEEFVKAYQAGEDPVAAVNRYNREQWEIFLKALMEHIQLLGQALMGIEAMRAFQQALEEALEAANATRQRRAGEWLRTRERARAKADAGGRGGGEEPPPEGGPVPGGAPDGGGGKLTPRDWRRIRLRKESGETPVGSPEEKAADERYHREFPANEDYYDQYGQTVGTVSLSEDGQTITVTTVQMSPDGTLSAPTVETMPAGAAPEDLGLSPGGSYGFAYTNMGPR